MLNIAIDARPLTNAMDGIARYTLEMSKRLISHSEYRWHLYAHQHPVHDAGRVTTRLPTGGTTNSFFVSQVLFPRWASEDNIDVFWSPRHHLPVFLTAPSIVTVHDLCWKTFPRTMPLARRLLEKHLMPHSMQKADKILTVSESIKAEITSYWPSYRNKTSCISPGRQQLSKYTGSPPQKPFILAVGTLEPRKNYPLLLEAFAQISAHVPHDLVIVGREGWQSPSVDQLINTGLENRVQIKQTVSDETLGMLYACADWLVTTSLYEGFNLPILEALSVGTPVMASDIPTHREVAQTAGVFFKPTHEAFYAVLKDTLTKTNLRAECALQAQLVSRTYDWDIAASELLNAIKTVVSQ